MRYSGTLLAFLVLHIVHALTVSIPLPPSTFHNVANSTSSVQILSPLTRLPDMPDLRTDITIDATKPLNPVGMLTIITSLMYIFSTFPWTGSITSPTQIILPKVNVEIVYLQSLSTQIKYAVAALYEVGLAVAQGNRFYTLEAKMIVDGIRVAGIYMNRETLETIDASVSNVSAVNAILTTLDTITANGTANISVNPLLRGTFADPTDTKLVIAYELDGTRIGSTDVFTACLDGLAEVPLHEQDGTGVIINALSAGGEYAVRLNGPMLQWKQAANVVMYLFTNIVVGRRNFGGMVLSVTYDGVNVANGFLGRVGGRETSTFSQEA